MVVSLIMLQDRSISTIFRHCFTQGQFCPFVSGFLEEAANLVHSDLSYLLIQSTSQTACQGLLSAPTAEQISLAYCLRIKMLSCLSCTQLFLHCKRLHKTVSIQVGGAILCVVTLLVLSIMVDMVCACGIVQWICTASLACIYNSLGAQCGPIIGKEAWQNICEGCFVKP